MTLDAANWTLLATTVGFYGTCTVATLITARRQGRGGSFVELVSVGAVVLLIGTLLNAWMSWLGTAIAAAWMLVPLLLLLRTRR